MFMTFTRTAELNQRDYMLEAEAWLASLTPAQQYAAYYYVDYGFMEMNQSLYHGGALTSEAADLASALDNSTKERLTVYRGGRRLPEIVDGCMNLNGFVSATADPMLVHRYTPAERPIVFEINSIRRSPVSAAAPQYNQSEREFILGVGEKFRVDEIHENVEWHSHYGDSGYGKTLSRATVVNLTQV